MNAAAVASTPSAVRGVAEVGFAVRDGATRLTHLYQHDPMRVLFPAPEAGDPSLAVLVTTSGGLVAGDRVRVALRLDAGARAHLTASAAEKIYRSTGATTEITQDLSLGESAWLEFLPPETILYDRARLFIAPTRFASGLPHKIHEAAAFGLPVVTTRWRAPSTPSVC